MAVANIADEGDEQYGGYDYSFTETVHDRYMCSICTKPLRDPHLTTCCGQHFCESCLTSWFRKHHKESCPHCRAEGKDFQHFINKSLDREIKSLKIQCTMKKEGCNWEGELRSLDNHLKSAKGCGYVSVECPSKCRAGWREATMVKRKDLDKHLKEECNERPYQCEHCGHKDTYGSITGKGSFTNFIQKHYRSCSEYPLSCPNKCGVSGIKRKDMKVHRSECPLEPVECPFKEAGCDVKLVRQQLETHVSEYLQKHVLILMEDREKMKKELVEIKHDYENVKTELTETKQALSVDVKILRTATSKGQTNTALASIQSHLGPSTSTNKLVNSRDQIVFRMPNFSRYKENGNIWNSPLFYVHCHCYKYHSLCSGSNCSFHYMMCVSVCARGVGSGEDSHVSISLHLLKGDHDDVETLWPFAGCNVQLKIEVQSHTTSDTLVDTVELPCECKQITRVEHSSTSEHNHKVLEAREEFVSHQSIIGEFVYEDSLLFKITLEDRECDCDCYIYA